MRRMMTSVVHMSAAACAEAVSSCANMGMILDAALLVSIFVALLTLRLISLISLLALSLLALLVLHGKYCLKARLPIFA